MAKEIYEVHGTASIEVIKRVKANNEDEAKELAECYFGGLCEYCGNGGVDKLIGVGEDSESVYLCDGVEWREANVTDDNRFDEETDDDFCTYTCKLCGELFECDNDEDFNRVELELWNHIQMNHEEEYEECQDWDTLIMLEEYFEKEKD